MRPLWIAILLALLAAAAAAQPALVETRAAVHLKHAPSAHARSVATAAAGAQGRVLSRKGSWVRVEIGGHTGWLQASQVRPAAAEPPHVADAIGPVPDGPAVGGPTTPVTHELRPVAPGAPLAPSKVRSEAWVGVSKFHEADQVETVVVRKSTKLRGMPDGAAAVVGLARPGNRLHRIRVSSDRRWSLVDAGAGEVAWIDSAAVQPLSADASAPAPGEGSLADSQMTPAAVARSGAGPAGEGDAAVVVAQLPSKPPSGVWIGVGGGLAVLSQRYVSDGRTALSSYQYSVDSAVVRGSIGYARPFARRLFFGLDGNYAYAGGGAIRYPAGDPNQTQVSVQQHDADAGAQLGVHVDVLGGLDLRLRAGGRMTAHILQIKPSLQIPSDRLLGATVGLGLDAPQVTTIGSVAVGLHVYGEALLHGSLQQGAGLSTGSSAGTWGGRFGGALSFELLRARRGSLTLFASYLYQIDLTHFTGPSYLDPSITSSDLGSAVHVVTGALAYGY